VPALIYFIFSLLRFLFKFYFFIKLNNQLNLSFKYVSKKIIMRLIKLSIGHMSDIWANLIRHSGVIFIIGIFLNPYMVGYISTVKTLFYFFPASFFLKINSVSNYEFSNLFGKKKFNSIKKFFFKYIKIILILILSYFIISILIGPYVYKIWLNNEYQLKTLFLLIIIIDASMFILRQVMISPLTAINKNITLGISDFIFAIIGIMLFFLSFYFANNYIYAFTLVAICSTLSLISSIIYSLFFFKNIKK
jgi:O-antigen/teichoic acid export membrane protein